MKAKKPKRHGHTGNRKNVILQWRYTKSDIAEAKKMGTELSSDWKSSPPVTLKLATDYQLKNERLGYETRLKTIKTKPPGSIPGTTKKEQ